MMSAGRRLAMHRGRPPAQGVQDLPRVTLTLGDRTYEILHGSPFLRFAAGTAARL